MKTIEDIKNLVAGKDYDFLRNNEHLGKNIILLGPGGSYAYGTAIETSDVDIRGIALNSADEILTDCSFDQVIDSATDTTIYGFNKMISLLTSCNPNTIEILGLKPDYYIYLSDIGKELLNNYDMFLSKKAAYSFGGYATAQLRRLDNKSARTLTEKEHETHVMNSIINAKNSFNDKYFYCPEDSINLYVDDAVNDSMESEIFMDINLHHYPLRDYKCMWAEMNYIVKDYAKLGKRNNHAIAREALGKHMMHLIRLYLMCLDILNEGKIVTYREKEHDLLMNIRNGKYLNNNLPTKEFMDMVDYYEQEINRAKEISELPDVPDYNRINKFRRDVNHYIVCMEDAQIGN